MSWDKIEFEYFQTFGNRIINDWKLPISIGSVKDLNQSFYFNTFKKFLEYTDNLHKWTALVSRAFDVYMKPEELANDYYEYRDKIINGIKNSESFQKFNNTDMTQFIVKSADYPLPKRSNLYNNDVDSNIYYISIDLKFANFTALRFFDPNIFGTFDNGSSIKTYEDLIKFYIPDNKKVLQNYVKYSKYDRQVIFGQLNPRRTIALENYIIKSLLNKLWFVIRKHKDFNTIECINADEIILSYNTLQNESTIADINEVIINFCKQNNESQIRITPDCFKVTEYKLKHYAVINTETQAKCFDFYYKYFMYPIDNTVLTDNDLFKCIPKQYFCLITALFNGKPVEDWMKKIYVNNMEFVLDSALEIHEV
jgi:hypothetical protein